MKKIIPLTELPLKEKRVFVRVDFNVPLKKEEEGYVVSDATRILGAIPTIKYIIEQGGKCILASHLGRPKGAPNAKYSLEPVGKKLSELLNQDIIFTEETFGDGPKSLSLQMRAGQVMLLENLRFHKGEEENSPELAAKLLELCDVFVGDAFGTLHRAHASTFAAPKLAPLKGMGLLVENELSVLGPLKDNPTRPFALVMGGSKVSDKMGVIEHFLPKVDKILIGGAMAYAFLKAKQKEIGKSLCDDAQVILATRLLKSAAARDIPILLPIDHGITPAFDNHSVTYTKTDEVPADQMAVDIGPKTLMQFQTALEGVETILWNGPMGVFEVPAFAKGSFELARIIGASKAKKMAGGGDVVAAIAQSGCESQFDFISTGGGATLEFLEGKQLPGLTALEVGA